MTRRPASRTFLQEEYFLPNVGSRPSSPASFWFRTASSVRFRSRCGLTPINPRTRIPNSAMTILLSPAATTQPKQRTSPIQDTFVCERSKRSLVRECDHSSGARVQRARLTKYNRKPERAMTLVRAKSETPRKNRNAG